MDPERFVVEIDGKICELGPAQFAGVLYQFVTTLVFEKLVDRVTFILATGERELSGSGGSHFDPICVSLYRHLKEERYHGPLYQDVSGDTQSFRLRSIADALVAVAFFLRGGDSVPHLIIGNPDADPLVALDRGSRTRISVDDPDIVAKLNRMIPC